MHKFGQGGWFTVVLASGFFIIMYGWYFGRKLKNRYLTFVNVNKYLEVISDLSKDESVPKTATNLVYVIKANYINTVESKVIYSILQKQPKRADLYWFIHVDRRDDPHTFEYKMTTIIPGKLIRVDFHLGFKVEPNINRYFMEVVENLKQSGEISNENGFDSAKKHALPADFLFVLIDRVMLWESGLNLVEKVILKFHNFSRLFCISDISAYRLDPTRTIEEKVPIEREIFDIKIARVGSPDIRSGFNPGHAKTA
jgi:KUP system potassium uptake protein